jgi:hypothetical protein
MGSKRAGWRRSEAVLLAFFGAAATRFGNCRADHPQGFEGVLMAGDLSSKPYCCNLPAACHLLVILLAGALQQRLVSESLRTFGS